MQELKKATEDLRHSVALPPRESFLNSDGVLTGLTRDSEEDRNVFVDSKSNSGSGSGMDNVVQSVEETSASAQDTNLDGMEGLQSEETRETTQGALAPG